MQLCADKESPLDIMFDNMLFWHRQSRDLGAKLDAICGKIKNEDDRREAMCLARIFLSARENAQRCAVPALVTTSSCAADTGLTQRRSLSHTFT
jgi:hypothetical protein